MKKLSIMIFFVTASALLGAVNTMEFNGTATIEAGVEFSFTTGNFVNSSDGTKMNIYNNHPYANFINGGGDYKDISISQSIHITTVNVSYAVNVQYFKLQFLNDDVVVKELSSITTGNKSVDVIANKIRFYDEGFSSSGGIELESVSWDDSMPVELTSFAVMLDGNKARLVWQTATEINNYGFEIHRSSNENNWETIGFVEGNGNSSSPKEYSFIDQNSFHGEVKYRLKQIDNDGSFEYSETVVVNTVTPTDFELHQNYPNPFNPVTKIKFSTTSPLNPSPYQGEGNRERLIVLKIYDILGNEIATLLDEQKPPGMYEVIWDAGNQTSGIYFYKIEADNFSKTMKMILLK
jgi:hypothetical protein